MLYGLMLLVAEPPLGLPDIEPALDTIFVV
jgi:hypothetical protein